MRRPCGCSRSWKHAPSPASAKNLLAVARGLAEEQAASIRIVVFTRHEKSNAFIEACERAGVAVDVIGERYRFDLGVIPQLRNIIHRSAPDILQSHITKSHCLIFSMQCPRSVIYCSAAFIVQPPYAYPIVSARHNW